MREKEELEFRRGYTEKDLEAATLRKAFLKKFIINFDTNFYKTQQERDWAYIVKREYNIIMNNHYRYRWDCVYRPIADGFFVANVVSMGRMLMTKKASFGPYAIVWPLMSLYLMPLKL